MRTFNFDLENNQVAVIGEDNTVLATINLPAGYFCGEEGANKNLTGSVNYHLLTNGIVGLTADEQTLLIGTLNQLL
jgi:hypothetical protein